MQNSLTRCSLRALIEQKGNDKSYKDNDKYVVRNIKSDNLCRHRRTDIRAQNDRYRLSERHQPRADKAYRHNSSSAAALQNSSGKSACDHSHYGIFRQ